MRGDTLGKAEILTPRLRLRRFSMQDMSGFLLFAADADTMLRAGSKPVSTPAEAESELRRAADDPYAFAITLRETGEVMGKIKYQRDYCRYNTDSISIGYELSRRYRHNGYMTEALRAMVQNAFEVMDVEVVAISHFVGNEPSRKVIERAGFIFEGVMPCGFKRFDGEIFAFGVRYGAHFVCATHAVKLTNKCACPYSVRKLWKYRFFLLPMYKSSAKIE